MRTQIIGLGLLAALTATTGFAAILIPQAEAKIMCQFDPSDCVGGTGERGGDGGGNFEDCGDGDCTRQGGGSTPDGGIGFRTVCTFDEDISCEEVGSGVRGGN